MIKLSLQSLCYRDTFNAGKITMLGIIDKAAEYQMDGVDLHYTHFESTNDSYLEEVKRACLKRGLHSAISGFPTILEKPGRNCKTKSSL